MNNDTNANTANGALALQNNTTGFGNTAVGAQALQSNLDGGGNTATGFQALLFNVAANNTADGFQALLNNTTGTQNTANGVNALVFNTTGNNNTATGFIALSSNTSGNDNTANGFQGLQNNTIGADNTATGFSALASNTSGDNNAATGSEALAFNTIGNNNTAIGADALHNNTTGSNNIAVGFHAGINRNTGDNNIDIGDTGNAGESNAIRIGHPSITKTFISGISGVATDLNNAVPVLVATNDQLGTMSSSRRFKKEIKPMDKASEAILALQPVTFHYKSDTRNTPQFGLIAEEVAEVNPDLVVRDKNGDIYTVRYEAVNAMLLNEFLKVRKAFLDEENKVQKLEVALETVNARLKEQEAKIEKVSAHFEINRHAPQVALRNQ